MASLTEMPGFFSRFWLAFVLFWKLLFNASLALRVKKALAEPEMGEAPEAGALPASSEAEPVLIEEKVPVSSGAADPTPALQLLSIMQREGRFIDFLQEDVASFSDAEVGAAARVVHEGCKRALGEYVVIEPVRAESEGEPVVLERGFDPTRTRVTGNVVGEPPFRGRLAHHGWQVAALRLPQVVGGHDPNVVAPAEVEL